MDENNNEKNIEVELNEKSQNVAQSKKGISFGEIIIIMLIIVLFVFGVFYLVKKLSTNQNVNQEISNIGDISKLGFDEEEDDTLGISLTTETYPKVDGATAMKPMSVEIAKKVLGMTTEEAEEYIVHNTTAKAYQNLIDKKTDLIFVSEPSDDILNTAKEAGVEFEMVGIGRDGFVFVVNKENDIESLTIEQIQKIYTGEITNWSEVGGEDIDIVAYQREANSGSQNLMEKMVMKKLKMKEVPTSLMISEMEGLIDAVASYENSKASIGYSIYLYAKEQYVKDSIKFLSINGVYPTDDTIADGSYPLSKIVYAIYRKDEPEDSTARQLVDWLLTDEGQEVVEAGGYTRIN